ncbi:MAG: SBBP repeat-containing protein [Candidatus Thorarchaeota archaeon]
MAVDSSGNAYVTGWTESPDFPTVRAYNSTYGGVHMSLDGLSHPISPP